jgi:hypothetical protein
MNNHVKFHGNWIKDEHSTKQLAQHVILASCSNTQAHLKIQKYKNQEINIKKLIDIKTNMWKKV